MRTFYPHLAAFHSCCLSHHVFDQLKLWPAWLGIEIAIFWQCSPGTVETQHLYPLRHGPRGAIEGSNYWGYGYKTQHSYPMSRLITWRRPEVKFCWNVVKKKQHKNYQDEDKKSAINKKLIFSVLFYGQLGRQSSTFCKFSFFVDYDILLLLLLLFTTSEFFALADGLFLEFKLQQVSSSLQDSFQ